MNWPAKLVVVVAATAAAPHLHLPLRWSSEAVCECSHSLERYEANHSRDQSHTHTRWQLVFSGEQSTYTERDSYEWVVPLLLSSPELLIILRVDHSQQGEREQAKIRQSTVGQVLGCPQSTEWTDSTDRPAGTTVRRLSAHSLYLGALPLSFFLSPSFLPSFRSQSSQFTMTLKNTLILILPIGSCSKSPAFQPIIEYNYSTLSASILVSSLQFVCLHRFTNGEAESDFFCWTLSLSLSFYFEIYYWHEK